VDELAIKKFFSALPAPDCTSDYLDMMSAHEAGHATLGITLGARVEAVYALLISRAPISTQIRVVYHTKFGRFARLGLNLKDRILLTAGGAAGEFVLRGIWDQENAQVDRKQLEELEIWNFEYCVEQAIDRLSENRALLVAARDKIRLSMINFKQCKLARKGSHVILAMGSDIEKLFRDKGFSVSSEALDLEIAKSRRTGSLEKASEVS
jgi:hypothetical protein